MHKRLFIFIEGDDDERFFQRVITPIFEGKYDSIKPFKYARTKPEKVDSFLRNIKTMEAEYIFVTDINLAPCVTAKKQEIQDKFSDIDKDRIIVVIKEIEGWYLAGLDDSRSRGLGISSYNNSDSITKEQFNNLIPRKWGSRIAFLQEILKHFHTETAKQKNKSFRYFLNNPDKYGCN